MDEPEKKSDANAPPAEDELTKAKRERDEYLNGWKRAKADLINYQKDESKRFLEFSKFAGIDIVRDLIPVLDSFDLAISVLEKDGKAERGVYMIRSQLEDALRKRGLERMLVTIGQAFNPAFHESIGEIESNSPPGTIGEVIEYGYLLEGRVVRPARVKLSKIITK